MRRTRRRRAVLRLWCLALCLLALPAGARAAALIEMRIDGTPVRLVADRSGDRALLHAGDMRALFDLAGGAVYVSAGGISRRVHARFRPGYADTPYRVELFGAGPVLAGFVTRYHVLFVGEQICAELMAASWMTPFVDPAIRALGILEALQPVSADPCERVPLTTYAAVGWPLIAGKIDHPTLETTSIAFDYQPAPGELALPAAFEEGDLQQLREVAKAAGF
jgi:hypothetical protein